MKESLLNKIKPFAIKYAEVISNVINVDVEIVDKDLKRIAGTGIFKSLIDIKCDGVAYKEVLKTGKNKIITEPGNDICCHKCKFKNDCKEEMEISTPITYKNEIVGVIGLVCSSKEQKKGLLKTVDAYVDFLDKISELISSKIYAEVEKENRENSIKILNQVTDNVDNGIVILDDTGYISYANNSAYRELKICKLNSDDDIKIVSTEEFLLGQEVFEITIRRHKYNVVGKLIPIINIHGEANKIFIFSHIKKLKDDAYKITAGIQVMMLEDIIGTSKSIYLLKEKIKKISTSKSTVLITGESGTGKELIARVIHGESDRKNKPFIAINCAAIPDSLLESELFGYVKGAFSGADPNGRIGKFELANTGIIFLDEIGDMPLHLQVKLLRVLQERKFARIGSNKLIDLDIRVIAATNKDLKKLIKENQFREDLYYRLNVIPIELPALRDRDGDIEIILNEFIHKYNSIFDKNVKVIEDDAIEKLLQYNWPGNIRELENTVEFMINLSGDDGVIKKDMLPENVLNSSNENILEENKFEDETEDGELISLKELERKHIKKALDKYGHDTKGKQIAAKKLGIGIATLYRKILEEKE